jgi:hypothetical protein
MMSLSAGGLDPASFIMPTAAKIALNQKKEPFFSHWTNMIGARVVILGRGLNFSAPESIPSR